MVSKYGQHELVNFAVKFYIQCNILNSFQAAFCIRHCKRYIQKNYEWQGIRLYGIENRQNMW